MTDADAKKHTTAFGWCGLLAVLAFVAMWIACVLLDSSWTWGQNAISDFGISDTDAASYFKYGMIIAGALLAVFGVGEAFNKKQTGYIVSGIMLVLTGICLALVGTFTLNYYNGDLHHMFAYMTCIFMLAAVIAAAAQYWACGRIVVGGISIVIFCAAMAAVIAFPFEKFEVTVIVLALIWLIMHASMTVAYGDRRKLE